MRLKIAEIFCGLLCLALIAAALSLSLGRERESAEFPLSVAVRGQAGTQYAPPLHGLVNINTADAEELESLPGIGPALAERIIAYREENGPFGSIAELLDVNGIGPATFEKFKEQITV